MAIDLQVGTTQFEEHPSEVLFATTFWKSLNTDNDEKKPWQFAGIASDESEDVLGDSILKKSLDLSYAQTRGYVNWDHSREPSHQLGFLTSIDIISGDKLSAIRKSLGIDVPDTASVYYEGELYKHVPKAVEVQQILKSIADNPHAKGLGVSVDGVCARDKSDHSVVKAFVRGIALTPAPVHTQTLAVLRKSLLSNSASEVTQMLNREVGKDALLKSMTREEAVLFLLKRKPNWTYGFANQVVSYTLQNLAKES
jgi:hypothetical protein